MGRLSVTHLTITNFSVVCGLESSPADIHHEDERLFSARILHESSENRLERSSWSAASLLKQA
jgi:hypothetical protein